MDDSEITRTCEQLQFVKNILVTTMDSNDLSVNRERVTVAVERITLIEALLSEVSKEIDRIRNQNDEFRRSRSVDSAIQKESLQKRDAEMPSSTNRGRADAAVKSERQFFPDQGVIDSYSDLARKYGELNRAIQLMRGDVESAIRNIDDFWTGDDEAKTFVLERLRAAVAVK
jgi:hypothetical protein